MLPHCVLCIDDDSRTPFCFKVMNNYYYYYYLHLVVEVARVLATLHKNGDFRVIYRAQFRRTCQSSRSINSISKDKKNLPQNTSSKSHTPFFLSKELIFFRQMATHCIIDAFFSPKGYYDHRAVTDCRKVPNPWTANCVKYDRYIQGYLFILCIMPPGCLTVL